MADLRLWRRTNPLPDPLNGVPDINLHLRRGDVEKGPQCGCVVCLVGVGHLEIGSRPFCAVFAGGEV